MDARRWMWIVWPAFLAAAIMEMVVFAFVDPLDVHWLGAPGSMESRIVPPQGFALETIEFGGVRGKGLKTLVQLP